MLRVLALDPSSTKTGWALCREGLGFEPVRSGVLSRPDRWPAYLRLRCLQVEVRDLVLSLDGEFDRVVVEVPGVKQAGRMRSKYSTAGTYAAAVGIVLGVAYEHCDLVVAVASDHWTRMGGAFGQRKGRRLAALEHASSYERSGDRGGDEGDAISLGAWYAHHHGREGDDQCDLVLPAVRLPSGSRFCERNLTSDPDGKPRPVRVPRKV